MAGEHPAAYRRRLLDQVASGRMSADEAARRLRAWPKRPVARPPWRRPAILLAVRVRPAGWPLPLWLVAPAPLVRWLARIGLAMARRHGGQGSPVDLGPVAAAVDEALGRAAGRLVDVREGGAEVTVWLI